MSNTINHRGFIAQLLTFTGVGAAFSVASCCAIPIFLASFGIGAAWVTQIAMIAVPHRKVLLLVGACALVISAVLLWRQQRIAATCTQEAQCVSAPIRFVNLLGLIIGAILLWAGYTYV